MTVYFNPFGAKIWNVILTAMTGRCIAAGVATRSTTMAARGTRAEIDELLASSLLVH
jgi:hypothetical protein